jgi:hypothetical protein
LVPVVVRVAMAAIGLGTIALGVIRVRAAPETADDAARVGAVPKPFVPPFMYRMAALVTAVVGTAFVAASVLAP